MIGFRKEVNVFTYEYVLYENSDKILDRVFVISLDRICKKSLNAYVFFEDYVKIRIAFS